MLEKTPKNAMDSQTNTKVMAHHASQPRVLSQGTNNRAQIILFQIYFPALQKKALLLEKWKKQEEDDHLQLGWTNNSGDECISGRLERTS